MELGVGEGGPGSCVGMIWEAWGGWMRGGLGPPEGARFYVVDGGLRGGRAGRRVSVAA